MGLRINNNLASLNASLNLGRANSMLSKSLARLSTGLKINNASDGPADLIISEKFRSQINAISKATENTQNAISMLSTAEGALNEVNTLLNKMKGLALKAGQTGTQDPDEVAASQAEIDAALQSINSIARNTSFGSKFLLDGSLDIATGEVDSSKMSVSIERAVFAGDSKRMNLDVIKASEQAMNSVTLNSSGTLDAAQTLKVTGVRGSSTITFAAGAAGTDIAKEINDQTTQTGVTATFNTTTNQVTMSSVDYGATEFVVVEDVDGTADILRSVKEEQLTNSQLNVSNQFKLVAKTGGTAGNNISLLVVSDSVSAGTSLGIFQDESSGETQLTLTLQDKSTGSSADRFTGNVGIEENREILTTLDDIKNLIESNSTLNDLIEFQLVGSASVTDKFVVDNTVADQRLYLNGGASGEDATTASLNIAGTDPSDVLTLTAKTAGQGGNDIRVVFGAGTDLSAIVRNSFGSVVASGTSGYFSGVDDRYTYYNGGTLFVNSNATFAQISKSISLDTSASADLSVSFNAGANNTTASTSVNGNVLSLTGGSGITGGRKSTAYIDLSASNAGSYGLKVTSKKSGTEGDGFQLVLRDLGSTYGNLAGQISIVGDKIIYTMSSNNAGTKFKFSNAVNTSGAGTFIISSKTGNAFANQFNWKFVSGGTTDGSANLSYDSANKMITVNYQANSTTISALATAIGQSSAILDSDSNLKVSDIFSFAGAAANPGERLSTVSNAAWNTGIRNSTATAGENSTDTTVESLISVLRGNASVRELIDIEYYASGTSLTANTLSGIANDALLSANFANADDVFGDYRFTLTGGVDGDVASSVVRADGVDGQVKVNGVETSAQNLSFTFDNGDVRGTIKFDETFNKTGNSSSFTIQSRGAFFQIGQKAQLSYQAGIALRNISTNSLGTDLYLNPDFDTSLAAGTTNARQVVGTLADISSGAKFDLAKNATTAVQIIDNAIADISGLRARVGAFISNTLESNINSLGVAFENLTAAESRIRDVDFAAETAEFTRAQILVQAGTSIAAQANVATQAALQLLG